MLQFNFDQYCYGCGACELICPKSAIHLKSSSDGFKMPVIKEKLCVNCGLCNEICIYEKAPQPDSDRKIFDCSCYAVYLKEKEIVNSASGGAFYGLALEGLAAGYEICGCIWDHKMRAAHVITSDPEVIRKMRGSKYMQSDLGSCYYTIRERLRDGKKVLFSGTPCQIAALHRIAGYHKNLITIGLICEGVASPAVFEKWIEYLENRQGSGIADINLRKKGRFGWKSPSSCYRFKNHEKKEQLAFHTDIYMYNYIQGLFMRNSCYNCQYKGDRITADLIIGDCWSASEKQIKKNNNKGISVLITRTEKGSIFFENSVHRFKIENYSVAALISKNMPLVQPIRKNFDRDLFFKALQNENLIDCIKKYGVFKNLKMRACGLLYHLHLFGIVKKVVKS